VDMIGVEEDLSKYDIVIAPVLYMVKEGYANKLETFVKEGGTFLTTFFSGIVNENDLVPEGGYPGELRNMLGLWVEEIDALHPENKNRIVMKDKVGNLVGEYECNLLFDLIHSEGAEVLAVYGDDFYQGMPVVTKNKFGEGNAWYIASSPDQEFLLGLVENLCEEKGIKSLLNANKGIEVSERVKDNNAYLFVMNHNDESSQFELGIDKKIDLLTSKTLTGTLSIEAHGVMILASEKIRD